MTVLTKDPDGLMALDLTELAPLAWECYRQTRPDDELTKWEHLSAKAKQRWAILAMDLMMTPLPMQPAAAEDLAAAWDCYRRSVRAVEGFGQVLPWHQLPNSTRQSWRTFLTLFVEKVTA